MNDQEDKKDKSQDPLNMGDLVEVEALVDRTDASNNVPRKKGERFVMPRARAERGVRIGWLKMVIVEEAPMPKKIRPRSRATSTKGTRK